MSQNGSRSRLVRPRSAPKVSAARGATPAQAAGDARSEIGGQSTRAKVPRTAASSSTRPRTRRPRIASPAACTIVARNYLSHARILARSYLDHHPDGRFYVLVVDGLPDGVDFGVEGVLVVASADLQLPSFYEMCFKYDVTELSTAVKPTLLSLLMARFGEERALYIDPDILVTRPLREVVQAFEHSSVILTPHLSTPIPNDGLTPSEQDILIAGAYNLGFIGLAKSAETANLLTWWEERLRDLCRADPRQGLMVDQRWVDLVPTLFPNTFLLKDETYNVAYWNLHSRQVGMADGAFTVNGRPLTFFHFSGFDPRKPGTLSKHQTRHQIDRADALGTLLEHYAALHFQEGYDEASAWSYGLNEFDNGVGISQLVRRAYLDLDAETRASFGDPFVTGAPGSFFAWITTQADDGRRLSPFQEAVYRERYDVACAFPDVGGSDRERFLDWAATQGAVEMRYSPALVSGVAHRSGRGSSRTAPPRIALEGLSGSLPGGVNVCGYIRNESGLGTHVRGLIDSLTRIGVDYALKDVSALSVNRSDDTTVTEFDETHPHPVNLVCVNADQHFVVMSQDEAFFDDRYNVGIWNWELPTFPVEWYDRFEHYDEIWAGSSMIVNALAPVSPVPVVRIPPVLAVRDERGVEARRREWGRQALGVDGDETLFLFMFDFHSYFERKNPLAAVRAFKQAFSPDEKARLVVKCLNGHTDERALQRLFSEAEGYPVDVLTEYVSREKVAQFFAACDVYVSLHRSEGIGLTIGEAMALGKPVVATAWSGNTDFMDVSNSYPISFELVELEHDVGPYRAGQIWAEPSVEHAAAVMRQLFDSPEDGVAKGRAGRDHVHRYYSPVRVARVMAERLAIIEQRRRVVPKLSHRLLPSARHGNREILEPLTRLVTAHVPPDATVAVVSRGDPELLALGGRRGWHFPQTEDGVYAGYHPADSATAIGHLDALQARGAGFLLVPATSRWWLDYYVDFREHLERRHEMVASDAAGALYRLRTSTATTSSGGRPGTMGLLEPNLVSEANTDDASAATVTTPAASLLFGQLYSQLSAEARLEFGTPEWPERFVEWATVTTVPENGLSPFLDLLYRIRTDVAAAFPDVQGSHRDAFVEWAATQGAFEMGYDPKFAALPAIPARLQDSTDERGDLGDGASLAQAVSVGILGSETSVRGSDPVQITLRLVVEAPGQGGVVAAPTANGNGAHP